MKFTLLFYLFLSLHLFAEDFNKKSTVQDFINMMEKDYSFSKAELRELFSNVQVQKDSLSFYTKPVKTDYKKYSWSKYSKNILSEKKVKNGLDFLIKYNKDIYMAYREFGIPGEYIVAIIGVESNYGSFMGKHPVFDTLSTLAFKKNRRNSFFKKELIAYLKMTKDQNIDPLSLNGSFAGAIGLAQFMPSNFKSIGRDFDKNGQLRIDKAVDAIGSVANYFKISGWKKGIPVATRVSYEGRRFTKYKTGHKTLYKRKDLKGIIPKKRFIYANKVRLIKLRREKFDELWYGTNNFSVITTYNHSSYYAMAVHQLAQKIKEEYIKYKKTKGKVL